MKSMEHFFKTFIQQNKQENRVRFSIEEAQRYVTDKTGGHSAYIAMGGYALFYKTTKEMERNQIISPIKSSGYNGMIPPLLNRWRIQWTGEGEKWDMLFMMRLSDRLDMSGYIKNPKWHTNKEKQHILSIYSFLKTVHSREWASCEERCLELFGNEKFLLSQDKKVLSRLNLSYEQLKMKKLGQMFTYWIQKREQTHQVIVVENHSTFFSMKRRAEEGGLIFGFSPDIIIFGDGKHIIKSLSFLDEITKAAECMIQYFGDIDPEGWQIYHSLKKRYPERDIKLLLPAYQFLMDQGTSFPIGDSKQNMNPQVLEDIVQAFEPCEKDYADTVTRLWNERRRIPQEFLTYEILKRIG